MWFLLCVEIETGNPFYKFFEKKQDAVDFYQHNAPVNYILGSRNPPFYSNSGRESYVVEPKKKIEDLQSLYLDKNMVPNFYRGFNFTLKKFTEGEGEK